MYKTLEQRVEELEKKVTALEGQIPAQQNVIHVKAVPVLDTRVNETVDQIIRHANKLTSYINQTILPALNLLFQQVANQSQSSGAVSEAQLSELPKVKN